MRASRGVVDHLAENDEHALTIVRDIVAHLDPRQEHGLDLREPRARRIRSGGALRRSSPTTCARPMTCARSSPASSTAAEFHEFKALYGTTLVCGFARIWGIPVAILANNGVLFTESAQKGAHFIELACKRQHPAAVPAEHLRLHGRRQIRGRRHRQGRRQAGDGRRHREVPKFTVLIGGSFGAGNYGMCGRAYSPALPVHLAQRRISVMGGEQAASVLATVHRDAAKWTPERGRGLQGPDPRRNTRTKATPTTPPRGCGTTASSTRPRRATCWASPSRDA